MKTGNVSGSHRWSDTLILMVILGAGAWLAGCGKVQSVASDPMTARPLVTEGLERAQASDYRGAMEKYDRAVRIDPANAKNYAYRGFARIALGDMFGGEADLHKVGRLRIDDSTTLLAREPDDVQTLLSRAGAYVDLGDYHAAIGDYDHVLRLKPTTAEVYYLRGNARYRLGDQDAALVDYDTALRLNAELLPAYVSRAAIHTALGNHAAAAADYAAARQLTPDDQVH